MPYCVRVVHKESLGCLWWNRPVCILFGFTRGSFCQNSPSNSEANRDGADAESPFPLFFSFSASFKNSSPREKVGNCLLFGTGGWSLFLSIIVAKYLNFLSIFPHANNGRSRENNFRQGDLLAQTECTIEIWSTHTYTEFDFAALLALL